MHCSNLGLNKFFDIQEREHGVEVSSVSVFEPFSCNKFTVIHTFISSRQVGKVDGAAKGIGFVLMSSWGSSP